MDAMELTRDGTVLRLAGQVDGRSTARLRAALEDELSASPDEVVLDLTEVDGIDLTALRMIAATSRHAALDGQRVLLRGSPPPVRRLLHLTRLRALVAYDEPVTAPAATTLGDRTA